MVSWRLLSVKAGVVGGLPRVVAAELPPVAGAYREVNLLSYRESKMQAGQAEKRDRERPRRV
jgi:hypothetical protein